MQPFISDCTKVGTLELPAFSGTRVMMLPLILGDAETIPDDMSHWKQCLSRLFQWVLPELQGRVGYLTIDEKTVPAGETHRRAGLHVDGVYRDKANNSCGSWGGGGVWGGSGSGGSWGGSNRGTPAYGMMTVSNPAGCVAYRGIFDGIPGDNGECEHLREQLSDAECVALGPNEVWQVGAMCVHESVPQRMTTTRQFVRLSMPSNGPWFEGYTVNPKGVLPTGPILPRRQFM